MINVIEKEKCTGCSACVSVCPKHCIKMVSDEEGFLYPEIDAKLCINCNLCKKKCHALDVYSDNNYTPRTFAAYSKNDDIRNKSSSGGIFYSLAKKILSQNGSVYGVVINSKNEVIHQRIDSLEQIDNMLGSKYVQSKIEVSIYSQIKNDLISGKYVLFSGTPCQCGAIKHFTKGLNTEKLYIISFICHGVPSPLVWSKYINWQMKKNNSSINNISFRDKTLGWTRFSMAIEFNNGYRYQKPLDQDYFLKSFLKNNCLREACYKCQYKGKKKYIHIDIMLADWWGAESSDLLTKSVDKGISAIFINTEKGLTLWHTIENEINKQEISFLNASTSNVAYNHSAIVGKNRNKFMSNIESVEFDKLVKKYCKTPFSTIFKRNITKVIYWFAKETRILKIYKLAKNRRH